jgi:hypothetical protein
MFSIYQLARDMSGAWRKVVDCDTWRGVVSFIDTYYAGYTESTCLDTLPVPKGGLEAAFVDVHGNTYVVYEVHAYSTYSAYPDIDDDYTDEHREYLRERYKYYDGMVYGIDDEWSYDYDRFWKMISSPFFLEDNYLPDPIQVRRADKKNSWYVGALHGI